MAGAFGRALPAQHLDRWNQDTALARTLFARDRIEIGSHGLDLGRVRINAAASGTSGGSAALAGGLLGEALSPRTRRRSNRCRAGSWPR